MRQPEFPVSGEYGVVADALWRSAVLTQSVGRADIGGGTLGEALTVDGVSLWDVVAPHAAINRFPQHLRGDLRWLAWLKELARAYYFGPPAAYRWRPLEPGPAVQAPPGAPLFLNFSPRHYFKLFHGVVPHLNRHGLTPWVLTQVPSRPPADGGRLYWHSLADHYDEETAARWSDYDAEFRCTLRRLRRGALRKAIAGVDRALWPRLRAAMHYLLAQDVRAILQHLAVAKRVLERGRPSVIVVGEDAAPAIRVFTLLARYHGIPTIQFQIGLTDALAIERRFTTTSQSCVYGQRSARVLEGHGVRRSEIVIAGAPEWDDLIEPPPGKVLAVRQSLKVEPQTRIVLFASSPASRGTAYGFDTFDSESRRRELLSDICGCTGNPDRTRVVVKPHPEEAEDELRSVCGSFPNVTVVDRHLPINDLIVAADVFITAHSTTALQALIADVPVIILAYPGCWVSREYLDSGATLMARNADDLGRQVTGLLGPGRSALLASTADARRKYLDDVAERNDGRSAARAAEIIVSALSSAAQPTAERMVTAPHSSQSPLSRCIGAR